MLGVDFSSLSGIDRLFYLGADNIQWFSNSFNSTFVRTTLVVVNIWLGFPYFMALMTGIMTAIDSTLYEAADIDGATGMQKITKDYHATCIIFNSTHFNYDIFGEL